MKSQFVNGTINKDIYVHQDPDTIKRVYDLEEEIGLKQDKLTAGENITISEDNVISANVQPGVFDVVYGETPFEDIFNAYQSGNIPVCTINAQTYYVSMMYGSPAQSGYAIFTNSQGSYTSNFDVVYPSTYSQIRTAYLESTANLVQTISADSTTSQYPSAKAVWNQAVKYTKVKRFIGHIQGDQEGNPLILDSNNLADIYNAQTSGNQIVFIFDDTNKLTYRVNYCFIDNTYPEAQKIVVYATAEHADTEQSPTFGVSERYFDTLYAKSAAQSQLLYPYTRRLQDKLTAGENITINNNVISATGGDSPLTIKRFVVFDGDLTFEEYFDPDNDVTIGRIVNPPEFDEIENGDARSTSHCPSLYDYVEIDGEPLVKARNSSLWYSSDDESFVSIGNEGGIAEDVYLEIRANSAGTHHVKILASYGGTVYVGYGGASITAYLNLTPRDVKIAYRTLKKAILAFQPLGGGPSTNYSTLSHFNELEDLNEEELYTIECGGFAYFAKYLRNFKSDYSLWTTRIDATIVNYFETSDTPVEDSVISASISPDQLISALNSGMMVNISFVRSFGDSTTKDIVPSIYYQITKDETYGIYAIELQPPHNYSGVALHGITTNNLFDKSNEWYHTINPLK